MNGTHDDPAGLCEGLQQRTNVLRSLAVQAAGWFIQEEDTGRGKGRERGGGRAFEKAERGPKPTVKGRTDRKAGKARWALAEEVGEPGP